MAALSHQHPASTREFHEASPFKTLIKVTQYTFPSMWVFYQ